jgi:hypothetical protein
LELASVKAQDMEVSISAEDADDKPGFQTVTKLG